MKNVKKFLNNIQFTIFPLQTCSSYISNLCGIIMSQSHGNQKIGLGNQKIGLFLPLKKQQKQRQLN